MQEYGGGKGGQHASVAERATCDLTDASARLEVAKVLTAKEVASQPSASQQDRPSSGALLVDIQTEVN